MFVYFSTIAFEQTSVSVTKEKKSKVKTDFRMVPVSTKLYRRALTPDLVTVPFVVVALC